MTIVESNSGSGYMYINKVIKTSITPINVDSLSIYVKIPGITLYIDRYDAYTVEAVVPYTDQYLVSFRIPLTYAGKTGIYSYKIYIDGGVDLDLNGENTQVASGIFMRAKSGSDNVVPASNDQYVGTLYTSDNKDIKFTQFDPVVFGVFLPYNAIVTGPFSTSNITVVIKKDGIEKRFTPSTVLTPTVLGGNVTIASLPLWGDGLYTYKVMFQNNTDQDVTGTSYYKLVSGMFKKFTSVSSVDI